MTTDQVQPNEGMFYVYLAVSVVLILFAGLMSGLTIGLMSLDTITLTVISLTSDSERERKNAMSLIPLLERQHLLLVTLLLANATAMETLPLMLDEIVNMVASIILSVTAVLLFGEVIPQALCKKYGISIGANTRWIIIPLMFILFPISWPISKLLDWLLGEGHGTYFRRYLLTPGNVFLLLISFFLSFFLFRAELKELIKLHGVKSEHNNDPLSSVEINTMRGVLEMRDKSAGFIMTQFSDVFAIQDDTVLTKEVLHTLSVKGFSRIPVLSGKSPQAINGALLMKTCVEIDPQFPPRVSTLKLARVLHVEQTTPLFSLFNDFITQKAHMAIVMEDDKIMGIVTLEELLEEILGEEIEGDTLMDPNRVPKRLRAKTIASMSVADGGENGSRPPRGRSQTGRSVNERLLADENDV